MTGGDQVTEPALLRARAAMLGGFAVGGRRSAVVRARSAALSARHSAVDVTALRGFRASSAPTAMQQCSVNHSTAVTRCRALL